MSDAKLLEDLKAGRNWPCPECHHQHYVTLTCYSAAKSRVDVTRKADEVDCDGCYGRGDVMPGCFGGPGEGDNHDICTKCHGTGKMSWASVTAVSEGAPPDQPFLTEAK